jgi:hypothetical protein
MSNIWANGGRWSWTDYKRRRQEQTAFNAKGNLEKSYEEKPLPKWAKRHEENMSMAIARRIADDKKKNILAVNPQAVFYTFYGDVIINDRKRRFTFDVDISNLSPSQKHDFIQDTWESIYMFWLPARNYYSVYESPLDLRFSGSTKHEGLVGMLSGTYTKGRKGNTSTWAPRLFIKPEDWQIYLQVRHKILEFRRKQKARREIYEK